MKKKTLKPYVDSLQPKNLKNMKLKELEIRLRLVNSIMMVEGDLPRTTLNMQVVFGLLESFLALGRDIFEINENDILDAEFLYSTFFELISNTAVMLKACINDQPGPFEQMGRLVGLMVEMAQVTVNNFSEKIIYHHQEAFGNLLFCSPYKISLIKLASIRAELIQNSLVTAFTSKTCEGRIFSKIEMNDGKSEIDFRIYQMGSITDTNHDKRRNPIYIYWEQWPIDHRNVGGHGIEFHDINREPGDSIIAFVDGFKWFRGELNEVIVYCKEPDDVTSEEIYVILKENIVRTIINKEIPLLLQINSRIYANSNC